MLLPPSYAKDWAPDPPRPAGGDSQAPAIVGTELRPVAGRGALLRRHDYRRTGRGHVNGANVLFGAGVQRYPSQQHSW